MRILLPYWRGVPKDCFYQEFHQGISEALQEFGHSTLPFYFADRRPIEKAEAASLYQLTKAENFDAVLDIACWGWGNCNARMCVVGKGWDRISFGTNVDLIPETDYQGIFGLAAQAKICVDASTYFDGVNDRVFSYAVNGAVCLTNASGYLRGAFDGNPGICFYSLSDRAAIGGQINSLLSRPRTLREAGNSAKQAVLSKHTWRNRIGHILPAMRL